MNQDSNQGSGGRLTARHKL